MALMLCDIFGGGASFFRRRKCERARLVYLFPLFLLLLFFPLFFFLVLFEVRSPGAMTRGFKHRIADVSRAGRGVSWFRNVRMWGCCTRDTENFSLNCWVYGVGECLTGYIGSLIEKIRSLGDGLEIEHILLEYGSKPSFLVMRVC